MMTRPDSFNQQLLNRDPDSGELVTTPTTLASNVGGYPYVPFPSPGTPQFQPSQLTTIPSASQSPAAQSPIPGSSSAFEQRPSSNSNANANANASMRELPAPPTEGSSSAAAANTNGGDVINNNNNNNSSNDPATSNNNIDNINGSNNNDSGNNDSSGSHDNENVGDGAHETSLQRNPSRPPPRYESIRNQLVSLPGRVRHSLATVSHEVNDQFAPRQRRRPSASPIRPQPQPQPRAGASSRTNSRAEMRLSSSSATPYDVDLMPPALAVIGLISSFLVFISLIVFVKISSSTAANIVGIAYSAAVLATSAVVVVRYWLEKRALRKRIDAGDRGALLGGTRRMSSLRRMAILGRQRQLGGRGMMGAGDVGGIEAGQAHEEMEMRGEIIVVPIQPVNRAHDVVAEMDPELPPYSPRRDQVIHVT